MAFLNERITEADRTSIGTIEDAQTHQELSLYMWAVDRERKAYLIRTGQDRDTPERIAFRLGIEGMQIDVKITQVIEAHPDGESYIYRLNSISSFASEGRSHADVLDILRDALKCFAGLYGTTKVRSVQCEF